MRLCSVRYAAPPLGNLRFAAPQIPSENSTVQLATSDPPACPQTGAGAATPAAYGFTSAFGNEDCLFLNVYAPANATKLPVFFWIRKSSNPDPYCRLPNKSV
jgi:carboxylesterase type B